MAELSELEALLLGTMIEGISPGAGEPVSSPNVIDLTEIDLDQPIYRIMPVLRCLEILHTKQLVLVRPRKWDDPFENALLEAPIIMDESVIGSFGFRHSVYGQCWTSGEETDAMWRIYSHDKQGIKAKTSPRKLLSALSGDTATHPELCCFIGRVKYLQEDDLLNALQQVDWASSNGSGIAASLLYKRIEFAHEKEIRLIYSSLQNLSESDPDTHQVQVDPFELIDELVLDPRMNGRIADSCKSSIIAMGFPGSITQSALYRAPRGFSIAL